MDFDEGTSEVYVPDQKNDQLVILEPVYGDTMMPRFICHLGSDW